MAKKRADQKDLRYKEAVERNVRNLKTDKTKLVHYKERFAGKPEQFKHVLGIRQSDPLPAL